MVARTVISFMAEKYGIEIYGVKYAAEVDPVDKHIAQWRVARPDLPEPGLAAMAVFARLGRTAGLAGPAIERVFARHGLTTGEFDVLAALFRSGEPFRLTPGELARGLMLSPAAMTNRLDRLEKAALVVRSLDPANRRSILVELTGEGHGAVDRVVAEHVANEERLLAALEADEVGELDRLLRKLLAGMAP
jgi:DNA-binding MarR family transcriptional regulator